MPRTKEPPSKAPERAKEIVIDLIRVRYSGGMVSLTNVKGNLGDLRKRIEKELKDKLVSASYRDGSMNSINLITQGEWPEGGALFIGPELPVQTMFEGGETINVLISKDAKKSCTKKKRESPTEQEPVQKKLRTSIEALAREYVNAHIKPDSILHAGANFMSASQHGALRIEAASKHLVRCTKRTPKSLTIAFRRTPKAKESLEEIRLFSIEECLEFATNIIDRQAGSKRRKASRDSNPSTRLLHIDSVASHSPELFWSLFFRSLPSDDDWLSDQPEGDVPFMLDHLISQATERFKQSQSLA
mmetsp:Transcript_6795/g.9511  ORF Transcript_6795/g.9511 Transcript_6795/m.9511 type:complete len:302 (+) Transcript_6795:40-945(+)|eukprot:CAMPEP_0197324264 /NCGR_PEP_ID=MMETSP0891-20130614/71003_1 /TAXON_ID=44058 ORGANISM="Aureoumbra lagunensis, Strain CCMP1510" /NCGR_SAMPLE_ID=MMETSP0891 /ASSEMBLY_ACC=CAM_ASM_000534 /LENGTH=301 /DNA_ID=CAMNT_0042817047 /DNA_START=32 /DNA_END=937 /DNA_ORIENTATION=+